ncbi:Cof-type HAD-IIB family hydrolase [Exiguobacterium artemiae]|uniref:Cof-type HAD-IIB family hydrolase n=1 Tax=Exiguobacterium artemiae TaxID=340145 RepID=UPI003CFBC6E9
MNVLAKAIKLLISDMDGTVLSSKQKIEPETIAAIEAAKEQGIDFAIATGRNYLNAKELTDQAGITCPIIASNGARVLTVDGEELSATTLTSEQAQQIYGIISQYEVFFEMFCDQGLVTAQGSTIDAAYDSLKEMSQESDRAKDVLDFFHNRYYVNEDVKMIDGFRSFIRNQAGQVFKFISFSFDQELMKKIWEEIEQKVDGIYVTSSGHDNIEVMALGADKGTAVKTLAKHLGVAIEEVAVIGDNLNDVPMFKVAGMAIAMGNGHDDAKAIAHQVTKTNDENGVGYAIRQLADRAWT